MRVLLIALISLLAYSSNTFASKCSVAADVHFDSGSQVISATQKEHINRPIDRVKLSNTVLAVLVVGHTDSLEVPKEKQLQLSLERANAVAEYVIGIYPELKNVVHAEGKGATQPVNPNDISKNRRVEIEVICIVEGPFDFPKKWGSNIPLQPKA